MSKCELYVEHPKRDPVTHILTKHPMCKHFSLKEIEFTKSTILVKLPSANPHNLA